MTKFQLDNVLYNKTTHELINVDQQLQQTFIEFPFFEEDWELFTVNLAAYQLETVDNELSLWLIEFDYAGWVRWKQANSK